MSRPRIKHRWGRPVGPYGKKAQSGLEYMIIFAVVIILVVGIGIVLSRQVRTVTNSTQSSINQGIADIQNLNANLQINSFTGVNLQSGITTLAANVGYDNGNPATGLNSNNFQLNGTIPAVAGNNPYNMTIACSNPNVIDLVVTDAHQKTAQKTITIYGLCAPPATLQIQSLSASNINNTNSSLLTAQVGWSNGTAITTLDISNFLVNGTIPSSVTGNDPYNVTTNNATIACSDPVTLSLKVNYAGQSAGPVSVISTGSC